MQLLDGQQCAIEPTCESIFGAAYEPFMDGFCISDALEFLACVSIDDLCDYSGPACSERFPDTVFHVNGCAPGFEPCEVPEPVIEGCGG